MDGVGYFSLLARYNGWATERLCAHDRGELRRRLIEGAARWTALIASMPPERFAGTLDYTSSRGVPHSLPFAATLGHVFNHGTHHRGQITAAITMLGHACPELDLVCMLQQEGAR